MFFILIILVGALFIDKNDLAQFGDNEEGLGDASLGTAELGSFSIFTPCPISPFTPVEYCWSGSDNLLCFLTLRETSFSSVKLSDILLPLAAFVTASYLELGSSSGGEVSMFLFEEVLRLVVVEQVIFLRLGDSTKFGWCLSMVVAPIIRVYELGITPK